MIVSLSSEAETRKLAERIAQQMKPFLLERGIVIGLIGQLGAGKTTFVRFFVGALGGNTADVASPSFTLQYEYDSVNGVTIDHWDLYRLNALPEELYEPCPPKVVRIIEWPDRCPQIVDELDLVIHFEIGDTEERVATLSGPSAKAFTV